MEHCCNTLNWDKDGIIEFETTNVMSDCNCNAFERCKWLRHFGKVSISIAIVSGSTEEYNTKTVPSVH